MDDGAPQHPNCRNTPLPHGVVHANPGDLLSTGRELYQVVRIMPNPRWLLVLNMLSGKTTRRKADDFEPWATLTP